MDPWSVAAIEAVAVVIKALRHATPAIQRIYPQGHQLMLALLGQPLNDMYVLTRKILMNEKDPHELKDAAAIPPCPGIIPAAAADKTLCAAWSWPSGSCPPERAKTIPIELQLLIIQLNIDHKWTRLTCHHLLH